MTLLLALLMTIIAPPSEDEIGAFRATAPTYLTTTAAEAHLIVARAAGASYHIRPELLLAIAHHESRYTATTRTPEPGSRVSCGVMTPVPKRRCTATELTMVGGYDIGASHLRTWLDHCGGAEVCALLSYAGGGGLVRACARGVFLTARGTNACNIAYELVRRASMIRRAVSV